MSTESPPPSLGRGAALTALATAVSRVTGLVRVVAVAAAMGTTFLANTYQTANTAPNLLFELVAAGVLTSVFVPTFVGYLSAGRREEGWTAANAMASVAVVALTGLALLMMIAAPFVMRLLTLGVQDDALRAREVEVGAQLLRLFAPQVVFYGAGMIMTAALHAHRRFVLAAAAPIFNNVVVIGVYLAYAAMRGDRAPSVLGVTAAETLLLGAGTTAGVLAMTIALWPAVSRLGWKARFVLDWSHDAVRKGARLGAWALGYAGGYQAGLLVVLFLANKIEGGVAAYQWAYTFFYVPHALFSIPIFSVLFTAMAEHAAARDVAALTDRLYDGLRMLAFVLLPVAAGLIALAGPLTTSTLEYGVMTGAGANLVARVLVCLAAGLFPYSVFLVLTRACYAAGESRLPTVVNAIAVLISSASGAALFYAFPEGWEIAGLAVGHSAGFCAGALLLARLFRTRMRAGRWRLILPSFARSLAGAALAFAVMVAVAQAVGDGGLWALVIGATAGTAVYLGLAASFRAPELTRLLGLVTRRA